MDLNKYKDDELIKELERRGNLVDVWTTRDIKDHLDNNEKEYTEELLYGILEYIKDNYDANIGITWDNIDIAYAALT